MIPERHFEYFGKAGELYTGLKQWTPGKNGPKAQTRRIRLASCDIPQSDGGAFSIQQVGPLVSTGNYDYWQFGWADIWYLSRALKDHPDGIMFTLSFSGPVDANMRVLGHPPIHIHHIHITPSPGVVTKLGGRDCMSGMDPLECYIPNLVIEQHGDYQCEDQDGGIDCFFERTADGHAKVLTMPLDLEGEINDVRAPDSEPMTWWYQIVLRWFPRTKTMKPLSQAFMVGPGNYLDGDQRTNVLVFPVNTTAPSFYWYTGTYGRDGEMTRNKLHSHNTMFHKAFYFSATPEDLGLDDPRFWPKFPYQPLMLKDIDFKNFEAAEQFLLDNLARAAKRWDAACPPTQASCLAGRPALTCESWVSNKDFVDPRSGYTFAYDRRAPCCCRPLSFKKGDPFTVVAFLAAMKTPPGPWQPTSIPPKANMHIHWLMTYHTPDNLSHYTVTIYNQNPYKQVDYVERDRSRYNVWQIMQGRMFGVHGMNNRTLTLWQRLAVSAAWFAATLDSFLPEVQGLLALLFFALAVCSWHLALGCRRAKHLRDHPAVRCAQQAPCGLSREAELAAVECARCMEAAEHGD